MACIRGRRPAPGSARKKRIFSLGTLRYLEIIAPDPLQPASTDPRQMASLKNPALVGWALHRHDLKKFASVLQGDGVECVGPKSGSNAPAGCRLTGLRIATPDPVALRTPAGKLLLDAPIQQSKELRLAATIVGPKGSLQLHSR